MTFEEVRAIARDLPGAVETDVHGARSFTVGGKLFLRLLEDGDTLVVRTDPYERAYVIEAAPEVFFVTDQIHDHPWVQVRLAAAGPAQLRDLIRDAWRRRAPRKVVDAFDSAV